MRYLSLFSGIEACTVAWHELGWEAAAYAEIEEFPSEVLKYHYKDVENLGDVSKITNEKLKQLGKIDLVVGGSPCQDLSVAGKRKGLEGERSGLFYEQMRIFHAARSICGARYLLWENVPGAYSSNNGRDFAQVVGEMAGCSVNLPPDTIWENTGCILGENGLVEWCTLDAQWFGVPQRRRRIFALLDTGDWQSRPPILFEPESLLGNPPPSREKKEDIAGTITAGSGRRRGSGIDPSGLTVARMRGFGDYEIDESVSALKQRDYKDATDLVIHGTQDPCVSDKAFALGRNSGQENVVAFAQNSRDELREMPYSGALSAQPGMKQTSYIRNNMEVRRLTPLECERLQGFPDNYTKIPWKGKPAEDCPDGPRYKALGNSMAVPVMKCIGERIDGKKRNN